MRLGNHLRAVVGGGVLLAVVCKALIPGPWAARLRSPSLLSCMSMIEVGGEQSVLAPNPTFPIRHCPSGMSGISVDAFRYRRGKKADAVLRYGAGLRQTDLTMCALKNNPLSTLRCDTSHTE